MRLVKFQEIVKEELKNISGLPIHSPETWKAAKPKIEKMIKEMDKATEVFEFENAPKKGK